MFIRRKQNKIKKIHIYFKKEIFKILQIAFLLFLLQLIWIETHLLLLASNNDSISFDFHSGELKRNRKKYIATDSFNRIENFASKVHSIWLNGSFSSMCWSVYCFMTIFKCIAKNNEKCIFAAFFYLSCRKLYSLEGKTGGNLVEYWTKQNAQFFFNLVMPCKFIWVRMCSGPILQLLW